MKAKFLIIPFSKFAFLFSIILKVELFTLSKKLRFGQILKRNENYETLLIKRKNWKNLIAFEIATVDSCNSGSRNSGISRYSGSKIMTILIFIKDLYL